MTKISHRLNPVTLTATVTTLLTTAMMLAVSPAQAISLVKTIRITSAIPNWLQISEVVATETGTGNNVALATAGSTATGSSNYGFGDDPSFAIDGIYPSSYPIIFHSGTPNAGEYLEIALASPSDLSSISIFGRTDCCTDRDVYNLELFDLSGASLFTANNLSADNFSNSVTLQLPTAAVPEPFTVIGTLVGGTAALRIKKKLKSGAK